MFTKFSKCAVVFVLSSVVFAQQTVPVSVSKENAETLKKNEALKPPLLPQEPIVAKEKTDAEDEGLKGKVKQVVQEREEGPGSRQLSRVMFFNEKGNFLEEDNYDFYGNIDLLRVYGYIDGKRVSYGKHIDYDYWPTLEAPSNKPKMETVPKPDTRFEYAYRYKYIDGKLAEMQLFSNTDKLGMRYVYNRSGNKVEYLVYTVDGELNEKWQITLDNDGNEVETIFFGLKNADIYGDSRYRYAYEFDKQGNWIKRTVTAENTKKGVTSPSRGFIQYQAIIYY